MSSPPRSFSSTTFRAMGCEAQLVVVGGGVELLETARRRIDHLERKWSRFLRTSDITRINLAGGMPIEVDSSTIALLQAMRLGTVATAGSFDPTLLAPLVGLGYQASWDDPTRVTSLSGRPSMHTPMSSIEIDVDARVVHAPAGTSLDAGGIGKGLAADLVATALLDAGAAGALVNLGGDVRVVGSAPQEGGWLVGVVDPVDRSNDVQQLAVADGGVATSGTGRRRWTGPSGRSVHHLLDPASGDPIGDLAPTEVVQATVVAGTAAWAEVWTKAVLVDGPATALPRLDTLGLPARVVFADGGARTNEAWQAFAAQEELR
jgi:FAD:protein FMN transferase